MERRNWPLPHAGSRILRVSAGRPAAEPKGKRWAIPSAGPKHPAPRRRGPRSAAAACRARRAGARAHDRPGSGAGFRDRARGDAAGHGRGSTPPDRPRARISRRQAEASGSAPRSAAVPRARLRPSNEPTAGSPRRMHPDRARSNAPAKRRPARRDPSLQFPEPIPANRRARGSGKARPNELAPARGC